MDTTEFTEIPDGIKLNPELIQNKSTDPSQPTQVEKQFVYEVYDKIAPHFSNTRYKPWPQVVEFLNSLEKGSLVCDLGCGNGKYLGCNPSIFPIGSDRSVNLLECAREANQSFELFGADSLKFPVRDGCFDAVISIAVIHHFSNDDMRIHAIKEMNTQKRGTYFDLCLGL